MKYHSKNGVLTADGARLAEAFHRYYLSNIPVDYWYRDMIDWQGPSNLKKYYDEVTLDVRASFKAGKSALFAGKHGVGKSLTTACILKRAVESGQYTSLYVNLVDIIRVLLTSASDVKTNGHELLLNVDFLVIDEMDSRFMGSENAADLFGRILEPIMRTRIQNRMPSFFCTNTSKIEESFSGPLQASIESLMKLVKLIPVIGGEDAREKIKKGEL